MATKYTRESEVWNGIEARKTPWSRQEPTFRPLSRRYRLFLLAMILAAFTLIAQLAVNLNRSARYAQPVERGVATVVARGESAADRSGAGGVTLEVQVNSTRLRAPWTIPGPYWDALEPGSQVAVLYRVNKLHTEIEILECGLVALKDDMR